MGQRDRDLNLKDSLHWGLRPRDIKKRLDLDTPFMLGSGLATDAQVERIRIEAAKNYAAIGQDWIQCIYGMVGSGSGESLHEILRYSKIFKDIPSGNLLGLDATTDFTDANLGGSLDSDVKLLLHFGGASGSTIFRDSSLGLQQTSGVGNAIVTTESYKFDSTSLSVDGSGSWVQVTDDVDWFLRTADFTIDWWMNFKESGVVQPTICQQASAENQILINLSTSESQLVVWDSGVNTIDLSWTYSALSLDTWYHFGITREGDDFVLWINGVSKGTKTDTSSIPDIDAPLKIGGLSASSGLNGFIDEFRIVKTKALYTGSFDLRVLPYKELNQQFLMANCGYSGTIIDE